LPEPHIRGTLPIDTAPVIFEMDEINGRALHRIGEEIGRVGRNVMNLNLAGLVG